MAVNVVGTFGLTEGKEFITTGSSCNESIMKNADKEPPEKKLTKMVSAFGRHDELIPGTMYKRIV
ncbi:hypothetical protein RvY_16647 [Ramazzottius varieornatus]|uniref:Uncharacterized protein n=1 Tax=Ramazzottius varieornatus TaxID=947166 RepID=A0A1D1VZ90_RAMVA|nr:hypothetical protein RvY_16647 [Ramazzottius varieornatus]